MRDVGSILRGAGIATFVLIFSGCTPMGDANKATQGSFAKYSRLSCEPGLAPSGGRLKRLNYIEYSNSIRDILTRAGQSGLYSSLQNTIRLIPTDAVGQFLNFDDSISQNHINGFHQVARQISEAVDVRQQHFKWFSSGLQQLQLGFQQLSEAVYLRFWSLDLPKATDIG